MDFGGLDGHFTDYARSRYAILPVPYEKTITWGKGTAKGPDAILAASAHMELYDEETDTNPSEMGIATLAPLDILDDPETMMASIADDVRAIAEDGKTPIMLGGEHSISPGAVQGIKDVHKDITVVQFDAHADLRQSYEGSKHSHACAMARIADIAPSLQLGIRSLSEEESPLVKEKRAEGKLFFATDLLADGALDDAIASLSDKVYITFDVDFFDPSIMPATGTPEPGGIGWHETLSIIRAIASSSAIVGADIVELSPIAGQPAPDYMCARLAYKIMAYSGQG